jgi:hypothetical protein
MKRFLSILFVFLFALSALYGQNGETPADPLSQLDGAVKSLAADIHKKLSGETAGKIILGQWTYNDAVPPLGTYWTSQLTEELANIPGGSFTLLMGGAAGADWTISGEIIAIAGTVRVYTRILRSGDRSVAMSIHSDFERSSSFAEMLSGGGGGSSSSSSTARDAYEPDSMDNPLAVEIGSTEDSPLINRTLHSSEDEDFFLLAPDKDGSLVMETSGSMDTMMELYEAGSNRRLSENDDGASDTNARIRHTVQAGSRYIAKVKGYSGETGTYGFRAYLVEQVYIEPDEYEGDDESSSAKDISIGEPQRHTFTSSSDVDWVKFQIPQTGRYIIRARGVNSNRLDTFIELYDQKLNSLGEDDDGGDDLDARLSMRLQSGTYYLRVECLDEDPDQPYTISITAE